MSRRQTAHRPAGAIAARGPINRGLRSLRGGARIQASAVGWIAAAAIATLLLLAPTGASAQEGYTFTLSGLAGIGGSLDATHGDGADNSSYQLGFSLVTQPKTHVGLRVGSFDLANGGIFGDSGTLRDATLTYATMAGEYRYSYDWYESGLFLGLGAYNLDGVSLVTGAGEDNTAIGVVLGLTGEFTMTRRFGFLVEIAGHWADLKETSSFLTAQAGVSFHF